MSETTTACGTAPGIVNGFWKPIRQDILEDHTLGLDEHRALMVLAAQSTEWEIRPAELAKKCGGFSRRWGYAVLEKLISRGFVESRQSRDGRGCFGQATYIFRFELVLHQFPQVAASDEILSTVPTCDDEGLPRSEPLQETPHAEAPHAVIRTGTNKRNTTRTRSTTNTKIKTTSAAPQQTGLWPAMVPDPTDEIIEAEIVEEPSRNAGTLVAAWLDHCSSAQPKSTIARVGQRLKKLLDDGVPYEVVERGLAAWHRSDSAVASIDHFVAVEARGGKPRSDRAERQQRATAVANANRVDGQPSAALQAFARGSTHVTQKAIGL